MDISDITIEQAWAIGLFEGEGYFIIYHHLNGFKYVGLGLASNDYDVVEYFEQIMGTGWLYYKYYSDKNKKPMLGWQCRKRQEVKRCIEFLLPGLCSRRKYKALEVLSIIENWNEDHSR